MRIDDYSFGRIVISGTTYTKDVIILPDRVFHPWWRKEGHYLQWDDLKEILNRPVEVLYIGRGYSGVMQVPESLVERLREKGIDVVVGRTTEVVNKFNADPRPNKAAALHLTC
jgi:hypothetical protein